MRPITPKLVLVKLPRAEKSSVRFAPFPGEYPTRIYWATFRAELGKSNLTPDEWYLGKPNALQVARLQKLVVPDGPFGAVKVASWMAFEFDQHHKLYATGPSSGNAGAGPWWSPLWWGYHPYDPAEDALGHFARKFYPMALEGARIYSPYAAMPTGFGRDFREHFLATFKRQPGQHGKRPKAPPPAPKESPKATTGTYTYTVTMDNAFLRAAQPVANAWAQNQAGEIRMADLFRDLGQAVAPAQPPDPPVAAQRVLQQAGHDWAEFMVRRGNG
jgi:hypothetical protein